ncbi:MAG: hypothetical protein JWN96_1307, partial [Mycobacterium sp.]|nr:hypothetical protein [Mycobacterium sp.]
MSALPADLFDTPAGAPSEPSAKPYRAARVAALLDDLNPQQRAAVVHEGGP